MAAKTKTLPVRSSRRAWMRQKLVSRTSLTPGGRSVSGVRTGTRNTTTLTVADAVAIKNQISLIKSVSPNVDDPVQVIYGNQNWHTTYRGVAPEYFDIKRWFVDQGAVFSQDDVDRACDVCVIGRTGRDQLFGTDDPIGRRASLPYSRTVLRQVVRIVGDVKHSRVARAASYGRAHSILNCTRPAGLI